MASVIGFDEDQKKRFSEKLSTVIDRAFISQAQEVCDSLPEFGHATYAVVTDVRNDRTLLESCKSSLEKGDVESARKFLKRVKRPACSPAAPALFNRLGL